MGSVKMGGGAGLHIKNGNKVSSYGSTKITPGTFVEIVNNGSGEAFLSTQEYNCEQVSMVGSDKVCVLTAGDSSDFGELIIGSITSSGISWGNALSVYLPSGYKNGFFVMDNDTKILMYSMGDSGWSSFELYGISGKTLTKIGDSIDALDFTGPDYFGCFKLSETKVLTWGNGYSAAHKTTLHLLTISNSGVVDATGSFTFLTAGSGEWTASSHIQGCEIADGYIALIEDSNASTSPYVRAYLHLLSFSGNTLTKLYSTHIADSFKICSRMRKLENNKAVIAISYQEANDNACLMLVTRDGNSLKTSILNIGIVFRNYLDYNGGIGYELAVNSPYAYVLAGYDTFKVLKYRVSENTISYASEATAALGTHVSTYSDGNARFINGEPVCAILGSDSATWLGMIGYPGVVRDIGRFEVKESESVIDGVSFTSLAPDKPGNIWMLKGE